MEVGGWVWHLISSGRKSHEEDVFRVFPSNDLGLLVSQSSGLLQSVDFPLLRAWAEDLCCSYRF